MQSRTPGNTHDLASLFPQSPWQGSVLATASTRDDICLDADLFRIAVDELGMCTSADRPTIGTEALVRTPPYHDPTHCVVRCVSFVVNDAFVVQDPAYTGGTVTFAEARTAASNEVAALAGRMCGTSAFGLGTDGNIQLDDMGGMAAFDAPNDGAVSGEGREGRAGV